jgi:hypothetical protein
MSYRITLVTAAFRGRDEQKLSNEILQIMLDALFRVDIAWLKAHPELPSIYAIARDAGFGHLPRPDKKLGPGGTWMRYEREPLGQEDWKDIPTCLADGFADCEDLACWRAAELVVRRGIAARPIASAKEMADGSLLYHITVVYPDGTKEDPSKKLGMGAHLFG